MSAVQTPLVRLGNLFPDRRVYAKCEFLAPSGCFKIHGALHLLERLAREGKRPPLVVPSMGNTALGAAAAAREMGFSMVGVVPEGIARAKDEKLRALGVELLKIPGGGTALIQRAAEVARERGGYFVHPHLDPAWTDGYQAIAEQVLRDLPDCASVVFPVGGGGLLMGLSEHLAARPSSPRLVGCEPYNFPKYARFDHPRSATLADGLLLDVPHPAVAEQIAARNVVLHLVAEPEIRAAMRGLYEKQGWVVEPSSAVTVGLVAAHLEELPEPVCVILTGGNVAREDFQRIIAGDLDRATPGHPRC